ncbi:MAG TPA: hypothetical protein VGK73_14585 [Polyangiaceae bacterium]
MLSRRGCFLMAFALFACREDLGAADPIWGKQPCESCRMLVSEPRYAAQLLDQRGERRFFDDIGCLDAYLVDHPELSPRGVWVRSGERWVDARTARYADGAASPMAYGFVASDSGTLDFAALRRAAALHRSEARR